MKKIYRIGLLPLLLLLTTHSPAQGLIETMTAQLAKLELYLRETQQGYAIFQKGLSTITDIKHGDFKLHSLFFGSLETVSPALKKSGRVSDILSMQLQIASGCSAGIRQFAQTDLFSAADRAYLRSVFQELAQLASRQLDELSDLLRDGRLQLSDDERLHRIDRLYATVSDQFAFLSAFSNRVAAMAITVTREKQHLQSLQKIMQP